MFKYVFLGSFILIYFSFNLASRGQGVFVGSRHIDDYLRRAQILNDEKINEFGFSYLLKEGSHLNSFIGQFEDSVTTSLFKLMPLATLNIYNSNRPYGWGNYGLTPNVGFQTGITFGFSFQNKFIKAYHQPIFFYSQNLDFPGFSEDFDLDIVRHRFRGWNFSDSPERFGTKPNGKYDFGNSLLAFYYRNIEIGVAYKPIWWGPGQFNSLTFSNNARGFPHITFNTNKPVKTFLGDFEWQVIVGRLEDSKILPSKTQKFNQRFAVPFADDWRYLNAMTFAFSPKIFNGLSIGFSRTFHQYNRFRRNTFSDIFPIFDPFQKEKFGLDRDEERRDQQFTVFAKYVNVKAKGEVYFEFGRRDHALNWREFILNPEHARGFIMGFNKAFDLTNTTKNFLVRGEITHQQESNNRYIRYPGLLGGLSWHTHATGARGFSNHGMTLGTGIGIGSNVQTLEFSVVDHFNKIGILFERLENHQDFYYRAFGQQQEHQPWIDLSVGFLFDKQWNNLLLSSKLQLINGLNYQWQLHPNSTPDFPKGQNLFSVHAQTSLIYFWNQPKSKND